MTKEALINELSRRMGKEGFGGYGYVRIMDWFKKEVVPQVVDSNNPSALVEEAMRVIDFEISKFPYAEDINGEGYYQIYEKQNIHLTGLVKSQLQHIEKLKEEELLRKIKIGMLGVVTSIGYSMKLSDQQIKILNRDLNYMVDSLTNNK